MKKNTKAAVLFINGQSNATAHQQVLQEKDIIKEPLRNVFSLDRNPNQSLDIGDVTWSGWESAGKNLGETQDNTASFAYFFAKRWQAEIDAGRALPDLYIVQISVGSQGIINGMWNRDKEPIIKPGILGEADISLLPLALHINRLVMENLRNAGKEPEVIGWHWIGCEQEVWDKAYLREDFKDRYNFHFDSMIESMGNEVPLYIYKVCVVPACEKFNLPKDAEDYINAEIERQAYRLGGRIVNPKECPYWDAADKERFGILAPDRAHYVAKVQKWFADTFFEETVK